MAKKYEVTTGKRAISWILARMAGFGLGNFVVLETIGRKSDERRQVTVSPISNDEGDYIVSPYGNSAWVLNARANPEVVLKRGGADRRVRLVEVTGTKPGLVKAYHEREVYARRFMAVPGEATVDDFQSVSDRFPVFKIEDA